MRFYSFSLFKCSIEKRYDRTFETKHRASEVLSFFVYILFYYHLNGQAVVLDTNYVIFAVGVETIQNRIFLENQLNAITLSRARFHTHTRTHL